MPKYVVSKLPEHLRPADYDEAEHGSLEYIVIGEGDNEVAYQKDVPCTYYLALKLDLFDITIDERFSHIPQCVHDDEASEDLGSILYSPEITCEEYITKGNDRKEYSVISDKMHLATEKSTWSGEFKRKIPFGMIPSKRVTFKLAKNSPPHIHSVDMSESCLEFEVVLESSPLEKLKALISTGDFSKLHLSTSIRLWKKIDKSTKSMSEPSSEYVFFSGLPCDNYSNPDVEVWNVSLQYSGGTINPAWKDTESLSDITTRLDQIEPTLRPYLLAIIILLIFILMYSI